MLGCTRYTPFPWSRTTAPLIVPVQTFTSVWDTPEQRATQYSPVVTKYARALPDTPMVKWKSKGGILYELAPPYTLQVPLGFVQALNIATPEYSWAQSLVVAMHSIKLAYEDTVT